MFYTHRCELKDHVSKDLISVKNNNALWNWITIYRKHPMCQEHLLSNASIVKDMKRHRLSQRWWIIHPYSKLKLLWDAVMLIIYAISFVTVPFFICFVVLDYEEVNMDMANVYLYFFHWVDIVCQCFTGYYDEQSSTVILDHKLIFKRYLKSYLFLDVLTSLPYDLMTLRWRKKPGDGSSLVVALINLIPLCKLFRYFTFTSLVKQVFMYLDSQGIICQLCLTLILYTYIIHWFTCICSVIPCINMFAEDRLHGSTDSWIVSRSEITGISRRYERAVFIVLEHFTASGFGGIEPRVVGHIMVCTLLMILGRVFKSYFIIVLLQIVADKYSSESKYEQVLNQVAAYSRQKQLPTYMKRRIMTYYRYRFRNSYFREETLLSHLSDSLRQEVILHSCKKLVESVEIFHNLPKNILTLVVTHLKRELYLAKDMIIKAGTQGDCMFFLSSGTVAILTPTGKEVCFLEDGAHFGEVALLVQDQRRVASVVAVEVCEVYRLDRKDFRKCIAVHSDLFAKIEQVATERMQRTLLIEEQYVHRNMPRKSSYGLSKRMKIEK
ncbi:hypothetical protein TKK_0006070 [Trichogramma kaykai]|uniref:Cyclic nucleotide-binding domain-containing protein n=1 Tax=Trichogramma kaykai TaxID=54128 RepID=A0ABD2XF17_9HYME